MPTETADPSPTDRLRDVAVTCPTCDESTEVSIPDQYEELRVRPYVAAFGEYSTARCPDGHEFWMYYC